MLGPFRRFLSPGPFSAPCPEQSGRGRLTRAYIACAPARALVYGVFVDSTARLQLACNAITRGAR
jgi:hypothetical protein